MTVPATRDGTFHVPSGRGAVPFNVAVEDEDVGLARQQRASTSSSEFRRTSRNPLLLESANVYPLKICLFTSFP
jgi:hypothetical protein